ncbi:hypothetical protein [Amycolatopsis pretoriensis]
MEGSLRKHGMYYRCPARTLTPGRRPCARTHRRSTSKKSRCGTR